MKQSRQSDLPESAIFPAQKPSNWAMDVLLSLIPFVMCIFTGVTLTGVGNREELFIRVLHVVIPIVALILAIYTGLRISRKKSVGVVRLGCVVLMIAVHAGLLYLGALFVYVMMLSSSV